MIQLWLIIVALVGRHLADPVTRPVAVLLLAVVLLALALGAQIAAHGLGPFG